MNNAQLISPQNLSFRDDSLGAKRRVSIALDSDEMLIFISNSFTPPISWFLTDMSGELVTMGQISNEAYTIDLKDLEEGTYKLRIAGEVHIIKKPNWN